MSNIYDPNTKFNKIYMFIGNSITVATACLGIISWIIREISKTVETLPKFVITILTTVLNSCIGLFIFGIICLAIRVIYVAFKSKADAYYTQRKLTEFLHYKLIHNIRNNIVELEPLSEKLQKFSKDDNIDAISECYNTEIEILKNNLKDCVDSLSEYLSEYRNSTISVCIKIFKKRNRNRDEFQSEEIISLIRSSNTENFRKNSEKTFVGQNTDFTNLCKGQMVFFGSANLQKIKESGHYINDSKNWKENKYTSTLVTPIRYHNNDSNNDHNKNIKSDVIGFLCIDSQDEIKEWENSDSFELQIMAVFSDIIYVYIKEFYKCFENTGYNLN